MYIGNKVIERIAIADLKVPANQSGEEWAKLLQDSWRFSYEWFSDGSVRRYLWTKAGNGYITEGSFLAPGQPLWNSEDFTELRMMKDNPTEEDMKKVKG